MLYVTQMKGKRGKKKYKLEAGFCSTMASNYPTHSHLVSRAAIIVYRVPVSSSGKQNKGVQHEEYWWAGNDENSSFISETSNFINGLATYFCPCISFFLLLL